jgi:hypothetical protein
MHTQIRVINYDIPVEESKIELDAMINYVNSWL